MLNVGILLYNEVEVLDFAGPFEVFKVASQQSGAPLMNIFTMSHDGGKVVATGGLTIVPDYSYENCPDPDILAIPGGIGARTEYENPATLAFVSCCAENAQIIFSVCSGTRILARLGLLDGLACTSHHSVLASLTTIAPALIIDEEARFVDNGSIMTAGGISAGIDLALHIVEKLFGSEVYRKTIEYMEYGNWRSN